MNSKIMSFLSSTTDADYKKFHTYYSLDECIETIRGWLLLPANHNIKPITFKGKNDIYFSNSNKIVVDYKVVKNGNKFDLYELSSSAYTRFERGL